MATNATGRAGSPLHVVTGRRTSNEGFFQRGCVAEFFAEVRRTHDATHHFCVARFYVADEQNFLGSERFARVDGERVF